MSNVDGRDAARSQASHPLAPHETEDALAYGTHVIAEVGSSVGPDRSRRHVHPLAIEEDLDNLPAHACRGRSAVSITTARAAIRALPTTIKVSVMWMMVGWRNLCTTGPRTGQQ